MNNISQLRADKWLWAARFYKTRQLAIKAIKNGQISLNRGVIKPASNLKIGDAVSIKKGPYTTTVEILQLKDKRLSAPLAQELYAETPESLQSRERLQQQIASQPKILREKHKPDKRGVRDNLAIKRGEST